MMTRQDSLSAKELMSDILDTNPDSIFDPDESETSGLDAAMKDRRLAGFVRSFMKKSKVYREEFLDLADRSRRLYRNWETESRSKIKRANLQPSYGFMIIETLLPQICDIFFGDNQVVKMKGRDGTDAIFENSLTDFTEIQLADMEFQPKAISFWKNMLLDGTAFAKVPYRFQEQLVKQRKTQQDPATGEVFIEKTLVLETVFDGPDMEVIQIYDFFPDWRMKEPGNIAKMRGVSQRMYRGMKELKALEKKAGPDGIEVGVYENLDELKLSLKSKGDDAWGSAYWEDEHKRSMTELDNSRADTKDSDQIELWEYWGLADLEGNGELVESIITVANGDVVIRQQENFYDYKMKPFVACPNYIRSGEFYGIPELSAVEAEIREARALRNARLDQINVGVNRMWLVDRAGGIDAKNLYSRPGGIVFTNDMNAVKPIEVGDPSASSAQELSYIESNISQITAIGSPPVVGSTKSFARSATGVQFVQQFASSRLGLKAKMINWLMIQPLVHIMMCTNKQFVTEDQWVRASDPNAQNPYEILPTDAFFRNYDFIVQSKPDESDQAKFEKMQSVAQILQVVEQSQPGSTKMDILGEAMLRPILGVGAKKFMRTPEEMMQLKMENAQMRIQEQAANAQIGAAAPQPNANPNTSGGPLT